MNVHTRLCDTCVDSDERQILIVSWKCLLHLLEKANTKVDLFYLTNLQLEAGIVGERTMPLFTDATLEELQIRRETKEKKNADAKRRKK